MAASGYVCIHRFISPSSKQYIVHEAYFLYLHGNTATRWVYLIMDNYVNWFSQVYVNRKLILYAPITFCDSFIPFPRLDYPGLPAAVMNNYHLSHE